MNKTLFAIASLLELENRKAAESLMEGAPSLPEPVPEEENLGKKTAPAAGLVVGNDRKEEETKEEEEDPLYVEAAVFAISSGRVSVSLLQRKFSIGYGRANKLLKQMIAEGFVSKASPYEMKIEATEIPSWLASRNK